MCHWLPRGLPLAAVFGPQRPPWQAMFIFFEVFHTDARSCSLRYGLHLWNHLTLPQSPFVFLGHPWCQLCWTAGHCCLVGPPTRSFLASRRNTAGCGPSRMTCRPHHPTRLVRSARCHQSQGCSASTSYFSTWVAAADALCFSLFWWLLAGVNDGCYNRSGTGRRARLEGTEEIDMPVDGA